MSWGTIFVRQPSVVTHMQTCWMLDIRKNICEANHQFFSFSFVALFLRKPAAVTWSTCRPDIVRNIVGKIIIQNNQLFSFDWRHFHQANHQQWPKYRPDYRFSIQRTICVGPILNKVEKCSSLQRIVYLRYFTIYGFWTQIQSRLQIFYPENNLCWSHSQ